jgi:GT2 family glycosyltransferase
VVVVVSITFCIITLHKTRWLEKALVSIEKYCPTKYQIKLLIIGKPNQELERILGEWKGKVDPITSPVNLGTAGGRNLLVQGVSTRFTMTPDDDIYLTEGAIEKGLGVLESDDRIGAVGIPQQSPQGHLVATTGNNLIIKNRVISIVPAKLDLSRKFIDVNHIDNGAMLTKTSMLKDFRWDSRLLGIEDYDKSLQIIYEGKWKQALVPDARLIHDRSWLRDPQEHAYARIRGDGFVRRRAYRLFRRKWGLRFGLKEHILIELISPVLTMLPSRRPKNLLNEFIRLTRASRQFQTV